VSREVISDSIELRLLPWLRKLRAFLDLAIARLREDGALR